MSPSLLHSGEQWSEMLLLVVLLQESSQQQNAIKLSLPTHSHLFTHRLINLKARFIFTLSTCYSIWHLAFHEKEIANFDLNSWTTWVDQVNACEMIGVWERIPRYPTWVANIINYRIQVATCTNSMSNNSLMTHVLKNLLIYIWTM